MARDCLFGPFVPPRFFVFCLTAFLFVVFIPLFDPDHFMGYNPAKTRGVQFPISLEYLALKTSAH